MAALPRPLSGNGTTNQTPPFAAEEIRWAFAADFVAEEDEFVPEEAMAEAPGPSVAEEAVREVAVSEELGASAPDNAVAEEAMSRRGRGRPRKRATGTAKKISPDCFRLIHFDVFYFWIFLDFIFLLILRDLLFSTCVRIIPYLFRLSAHVVGLSCQGPSTQACGYGSSFQKFFGTLKMYTALFKFWSS